MHRGLTESGIRCKVRASRSSPGHNHASHTPIAFERTHHIHVSASASTHCGTLWCGCRSPGNFAHWWLAHLLPLVTSLQAAGVTEPFRGTWLIWHGRNRVLPRWAPLVTELLGGRFAGAACVQLAAPAAVGDAARAQRRRAAGCAVSVPSIATHQFAFRNRSFFAATRVRDFSKALRQAMLGSGLALASPGVAAVPLRAVVILRDDARRRCVHGLERACDARWVADAMRGGVAPLLLHKHDAYHARPLEVDCIRLGGGGSQLLTRTAQVMGHPSVVALLGGHGAGLATLPFLPPHASSGSRFVEFDHIANIGRARNMYQYLAHALGLPATKVWLNGSGARFCPHRTIACTAAAQGTTIHGCSVGYHANVTLREEVLAEVLRTVSVPAAAMTSPAQARWWRDCGVARDMERGERWWRLDEEIQRPFAATLPRPAGDES